MPPTFLQHIRAAVLCSRNQLSVFALRGYHPLWHAFPGDFELDSEAVHGSHILPAFLQEFGSPCSAFTRRY